MKKNGTRDEVRGARGTLPARPQNWPVILAAYLEAHRNVPFAWGSQDCCMFAADWVEQCLGVDPAEEWRGTYDSEASALKVLKKAKGVRGLADKTFTKCKLGFANRGDLVAYQDPALKGPAWARTALGILDGRYGLFATKNGVEPIERARLMKTAYRVGGGV